jgi:hypothetical protein
MYFPLKLIKPTNHCSYNVEQDYNKGKSLLCIGVSRKISERKEHVNWVLKRLVRSMSSWSGGIITNQGSLKVRRWNYLWNISTCLVPSSWEEWIKSEKMWHWEIGAEEFWTFSCEQWTAYKGEMTWPVVEFGNVKFPLMLLVSQPIHGITSNHHLSILGFLILPNI